MKSSKRKIISSYNWNYLIPQAAMFVLLAFVLKQLNVASHILLSLTLYLLLSGYLKIIIPKWHRKGLFYLRKGEFQGAVFAFQKSYTFFAKNHWIDAYRAFTLLSISKLSYKEMALMNIIYSYQNLNKEKEAKQFLNQLRKEFPNNPYSK